MTDGHIDLSAVPTTNDGNTVEITYTYPVEAEGSKGQREQQKPQDQREVCGYLAPPPSPLAHASSTPLPGIPYAHYAGSPLYDPGFARPLCPCSLCQTASTLPIAPQPNSASSVPTPPEEGKGSENATKRSMPNGDHTRYSLNPVPMTDYWAGRDEALARLQDLIDRGLVPLPGLPPKGG
jgi:hypothetical protein